MSTASTSFNAKAAEFVPRGRVVKTEESFPTLDQVATKAPVQKKAQPAAAAKKIEPEPVKADD